MKIALTILKHSIILRAYIFNQPIRLNRLKDGNVWSYSFQLQIGGHDDSDYFHLLIKELMGSEIESRQRTEAHSLLHP
jgi:hypothetical protein